MLEIKFRVWDKAQHRMIYDPLSLVCVHLTDMYNNPTSNWIWMQFTDLKDKNGKAIYEGDIVAKFDFENPLFRSVVVRENGAFGYVDLKTFIAFAANYNFEWDNGKSQLIEIVGNIHENKELVVQ